MTWETSCSEQSEESDEFLPEADMRDSLCSQLINIRNCFRGTSESQRLLQWKYKYCSGQILCSCIQHLLTESSSMRWSTHHAHHLKCWIDDIFVIGLFSCWVGDVMLDAATCWCHAGSERRRAAIGRGPARSPSLSMFNLTASVSEQSALVPADVFQRWSHWGWIWSRICSQTS